MQQGAPFEWLRFPEAEQFLVSLVDEVVEARPFVRSFAENLLPRTGSRLPDWLDHLVLAHGGTARGLLQDMGFELDEAAVPVPPEDSVYHHPGTIFPRVVLRTGTGARPGQVVALAIQVEEITEFLMTHRIAVPIEGSPLSPYRRATAWQQGGFEFIVVERRGHFGFLPTEMSPDYTLRYLNAWQKWATRPRLFADTQDGMLHALHLARDLVGEMGTDTAAWIAFSVERAYWQRRNRAGQVQKARQDSLGLGWANHDHQAFRSSRTVFPLLIEILEAFGFRPRERFYAGAEAGWGAQVMEHSACRLAVFADVDLAPGEVEGDFAHAPLYSRNELGTLGLWCALHGESMLGAGMHHLAARFDFDAVTAGLADWGVKMMRPFSDFPYLRQAFTQGERWSLDLDRLDRLAATGQIDSGQRAQFASEGALGSHMENIQRAEGFKGFNQRNVSDIIRRTDPRAWMAA